jgi:hypothetical protein
MESATLRRLIPLLTTVAVTWTHDGVETSRYVIWEGTSPANMVVSAEVSREFRQATFETPLTGQLYTAVQACSWSGLCAKPSEAVKNTIITKARVKSAGAETILVCRKKSPGLYLCP